MADKKIVWIGSSRDDVRRFPREAWRKAGYQLRLGNKEKSQTTSSPCLRSVQGHTRFAFKSVMPIEFSM
jgi:phage-related protein